MRFGSFTLNLETRELTRGTRDVHLSPKAFDLLAMLVAERPKVLAKDALQKRLWPRTFVAEANLSNLIGELRRALGDSSRTPRYIRTAHRVGYAFCASVTGADGSAPGGEPSQWLEWSRRRFLLSAGESIVGREPTAAIRLDHSTVSRRHARIVVTDEGTVLEDFGSKNGTYREGVRVTAPVLLGDGDVIRIGSVMLTFRVQSALGTTATVPEGESRSR